LRCSDCDFRSYRRCDRDDLFFSPLATRYIEGDTFRVAMEAETANGLHFPTGHYSPIRRTSTLTAQAESFETSNGERALKFVDAHTITARFDPWGVFIRQWRFNDIHAISGEVEIQIYEANPEEVTPKPWFAIFCRTACISSGFSPSIAM
jgi:hypothetical protein